MDERERREAYDDWLTSGQPEPPAGSWHIQPAQHTPPAQHTQPGQVPDWAAHTDPVPPSPGGGFGRGVAVTLAAVVALAAVGGGAWYAFGRGDDDADPSAPPQAGGASAWSTPPAAVSSDASGSGGAAQAPAAQTPASQAQATQARPAPSQATQPPAQSQPSDQGQQSSGASGAAGIDLGVSRPITVPQCDGHGIVILQSAVTPGQYKQEVAAGLATYPGAQYLRTDHSCPSLRQQDEYGNTIYAVYRDSGTTTAQICADVAAAQAAGSAIAYGRWLSNSRPPTDIVTC